MVVRSTLFKQLINGPLKVLVLGFAIAHLVESAGNIAVARWPLFDKRCESSKVLSKTPARKCGASKINKISRFDYQTACLNTLAHAIEVKVECSTFKI